ncbi:hypothetical protein [uncultured Arcticibacterium sp.]|uniref:DUF4350 domain-containing protein n=1 Tax=uncultured Arcticibacterium sp. TaxID=2173042 RepID=UPI0030F68FF0
MKRTVYIGLFLIGGVVISYWLLTKPYSRQKKLDKSFSLSKNSFKPYDTKFFYSQLRKDNFRNNYQPLVPENENFNGYIENNLYVAIAPYYIPEYHEIRRLKDYISSGNVGLISSFNLGAELLDSLFQTNAGSENIDYKFPPILLKSKTGQVWDESLKFFPQNYAYPGHWAINQSDFKNRIDSSNHNVIPILKDDLGNVQMVRIKIGEGEVYLSNNPLVFSNYFLLHKKNYKFLNQLMTLVDIKNRGVVWDDYYKDFKGNSPSEKKQSKVLNTIHKYPSLKIAFYTFIFTVLLFILFYYRRIQKEVEVLPEAKNQTLDFVNVITGLYWNEQNHLLMARKMHAHFLEDLKDKYHFYAKDVSLDNLELLSHKTGRKEHVLMGVLSDMEAVKNGKDLKDTELIKMYQNVQKFYKN